MTKACWANLNSLELFNSSLRNRDICGMSEMWTYPSCLHITQGFARAGGAAGRRQCKCVDEEAVRLADAAAGSDRPHQAAASNGDELTASLHSAVANAMTTAGKSGTTSLRCGK